MLDAKSRRYATVKGKVKTSVLRETLRKTSKYLSRRDAQKKIYIYLSRRDAQKNSIYLSRGDAKKLQISINILLLVLLLTLSLPFTNPPHLTSAPVRLAATPFRQGPCRCHSFPDACRLDHLSARSPPRPRAPVALLGGKWSQESHQETSVRLGFRVG